MSGKDLNDRTVIERVDPLVGAILDRRYRIEFRLAAGGFGAIYRARHIASNHEVAIKVLHARFASDRGVIARFEREGAALTTLRSPHTIAAYELGEAPDGTMYMVMELLHGVTLYERFRAHGKFPWRRMVAIARGVCDSLAEAHALGIVHRDLKPTNIHLEHIGDDEDFVKVLDFGIAKILQDSQFDQADVTMAGQMIGTLDYMSPEQMVGGAITGRTDIYTLGIVMYEMIAGRPPFAEATSASSALAAVLKQPPPLSKFVNVPGDLDRIVLRCLHRDAVERYDAADLRTTLDALLAVSDERAATVNEERTVVIRRAIVSARMSAVSEPAATVPRPTAVPPEALRTPRPVQESTTFSAAPPPPLPPPPVVAARPVPRTLSPPPTPPIAPPPTPARTQTPAIPPAAPRTLTPAIPPTSPRTQTPAIPPRAMPPTIPATPPSRMVPPRPPVEAPPPSDRPSMADATIVMPRKDTTADHVDRREATIRWAMKFVLLVIVIAIGIAVVTHL